MYVNIGYIQQDTNYRFTDKGCLNDDMYHDNYGVGNYELNSRPGHSGFVEKPESAYVRLEYYRKHLMLEACARCGKRKCRRKGGRRPSGSFSGRKQERGPSGFGPGPFHRKNPDRSAQADQAAYEAVPAADAG